MRYRVPETVAYIDGPDMELGRRLVGSKCGHRQLGIELEPAGIELLEQHIEGHDFGE